MTDPIPALLRDAMQVLDEAGVQAALIGGCARNAWAEVRSTKDVDFVVDVDAERYPKLIEVAKRHGFTRATSVGGEPGSVPDLELFRDATGRRMDLLYAHTEFERSALGRAELRHPYGTPLKVASREDLIVYKLLAGRPQDRLDILAMLSASTELRAPIDWSYVEHWCREWEVGPQLDRLRAELA